MDNINVIEQDEEDAEDKTINPIYSNETLLSNPIQISIISFRKSKEYNNEIIYEFKIYYKYDHWFINTSLSKIIDYIQSLHALKYAFLPLNQIIQLKSQKDITLLNKALIDIMKYLTYRYDILTIPLSSTFFNFHQCPKENQLNHYLLNRNLSYLYKFSIESGTSDLTVSDIKYDINSNLVLLAYEDNTLISTIGRFWSLIDCEALGSLIIYQKVTVEKKHSFIKKITKSFDVRVSKIDMSSKLKKIFIGFDNGTIHLFNVNQGTNEESIISITEGNILKFLTDRIIGFGFIANYAFVASKENKIIILKFTYEYPSAMPEISFNASLKKRIHGKGYIKDIQIDQSCLRLYILTEGKVILLYDIIKNTDDIKISFAMEINTIHTIQSIYFKSDSLFIGLKDKIQYFKLNHSTDANDDDKPSTILSFEEENSSFSSKYLTINPISNNQITSIYFYSQMELFIFGLSNGILITLDSNTNELLYAKQISSNPLIHLNLIEENNTLIISDSKAITFFFQFGNSPLQA